MDKAAIERSEARMQAQRVATQAAVDAGTCPDCGSKVKRNYSISGWWQCEQYGAVTHRARPQDPQCNWQGFTS